MTQELIEVIWKGEKEMITKEELERRLAAINKEHGTDFKAC